MADITLKRGDLSRPISRRLKETITDEDAATTVTRGIDLTLATSVRLILKDQAGAATGGGVCTVTSATNGEVLYTTVTADTATVRTWLMEWEITWAGGSVETIPNQAPTGRTDPYYTLAIVADLG